MKTEMYCYLEDHEKKVLPETEVWNHWLDPDFTAIACIDMHRGHVGDDAELTLPAPRARDRIPAHNLFHRYAREVGVPIIHVQHWQRHGGIDDARSRSENPGANWRHLYDLYLPPNPLMLEHSWEGTKWLDIMIEEQPEDYYIRTKKRLSAFYPTDFEFLLRQLGIRNLVITGTMTDACDLSTAFDAANRDFRVIIPRDVAAGSSAEAEHAALICTSLHLGLVVDAPTLLAEWFARKARAARRPRRPRRHQQGDRRRGGDVTAVDLHTHFLPRFFVDEAGAGEVFGVRVVDGLVIHPEGFRYPVHPTFVDVEAKLAEMDAAGIDVSVLSSAPTLFFYDAPAAEAVAFARRSNDALAEMAGASARLAGLATLPLQDPEAAAAELERAVGGHGTARRPHRDELRHGCAGRPEPCAGAGRGRAAGRAADAAPVLRGAQARARGLLPGQLDGQPARHLGGGGAADLLGALDRFPGLRVALVHAGGFLPYQIGRFDHAFDVRPEARVAIDRPPSTYLDRFWMDTITHSDEALEFLARRIGPDRLYIGTDQPFDMADVAPVERLRRVGVDVDATGGAAAALLNIDLEARTPALETGGA